MKSVKTANQLMNGNTHIHVMTAKVDTNIMYVEMNGQPCNNPACRGEENEHRDILWLQGEYHWQRRQAALHDELYQEGYDDGYEHALERHGIEEVAE